MPDVALRSTTEGLATARLGLLFVNGTGRPRNLARGWDLLYRAAALGEPYAYFEIARMKYFGLGGSERDAPEAYRNARISWEGGYARAALLIGEMYRTGAFVERDLAQTRAWYRQAAERNEIDGPYFFGVALIEGVGGPVDLARGVESVKRSVDLGSVNATALMGNLYEAGKGVPRDTAKALALYQKAANAGLGTALTRMGLLYRDGRIVVQDYGRAISFFRRAIAAGDRKAMVELAGMYERGLGAPKNPTEAERLLREAAGIPTVPLETLVN
ncbi:MAG: sel1 repeat family protein [Proteobacteria bacterium]|nr:sel1 repeat family protein [Pseudomonadota bacterium]